MAFIWGVVKCVVIFVLWVIAVGVMVVFPMNRRPDDKADTYRIGYAFFASYGYFFWGCPTWILVIVLIVAVVFNVGFHFEVFTHFTD